MALKGHLGQMPHPPPSPKTGSFCFRSVTIMDLSSSTCFPSAGASIRKPMERVKNEIDHVCISGQWQTSIWDVHVFRGMDVRSDQRTAKTENSTSCCSHSPIGSWEENSFRRTPWRGWHWRNRINNAVLECIEAECIDRGTRDPRFFLETHRCAEKDQAKSRPGFQRRSTWTSHPWIPGTMDEMVMLSCKKEWKLNKGCEAQTNHGDSRMLYRILNDL